MTIASVRIQAGAKPTDASLVGADRNSLYIPDKKSAPPHSKYFQELYESNDKTYLIKNTLNGITFRFRIMLLRRDIQSTKLCITWERYYVNLYLQLT